MSTTLVLSHLMTCSHQSIVSLLRRKHLAEEQCHIVILWGSLPYHHYICLFSLLDLQHIPQDERVSMSLKGDLYFANVDENDSRSDYCCFAAFPRLRTIVQKMPMTLTVTRCKSGNSVTSPTLFLLIPFILIIMPLPKSSVPLGMLDMCI